MPARLAQWAHRPGALGPPPLPRLRARVGKSRETGGALVGLTPHKRQTQKLPLSSAAGGRRQQPALNGPCKKDGFDNRLIRL